MQNFEKLEQLKKEYQKILDKVKFSKIYGSWVFADTVQYQKQYGFDIGTGEHATWNNEADAFKHTFMQAQLALLGNEDIAKYLGDRHEKDGNKKHGQTKEEEQMDQWNNAQGREIAKEIWQEYGIKSKKAFDPEIKDIIARKVAERMQEGKLILDLSGRRTPKKKLNLPNKKISHSTESDKSNKTPCVGSYPVSGYTRSDGREVKGYTRTCGAKHAGNKNNIGSNFAPENQDIKAGSDDGCWGTDDVIYAKQKSLEKYKGKKAQDLSEREINEFLKIYFGR